MTTGWLSDSGGWWGGGVSGGGGGGLDAATSAWIAAVVAAGGAVSPTQQSRVDALIAGLKTDSIFSKTRRLFLHAGESDAHQATIDIVNLGVATPHGTITLSAGGYQGDGSTGYLDSGFAPSSGLQDSATIGAYVDGATLGTGGNNAWIGAANAANSVFSLLSAENSFATDLNDGTFFNSDVGANGLWLISRTGAGGYKGYRNNLGQQFDANTATSSTPPTQTYFIAALHGNTGAPSKFSPDKIKATLIADGFSPADVTAFAARLNAYMHAWGVDTY